MQHLMLLYAVVCEDIFLFIYLNKWILGNMLGWEIGFRFKVYSFAEIVCFSYGETCLVGVTGYKIFCLKKVKKKVCIWQQLFNYAEHEIESYYLYLIKKYALLQYAEAILHSFSDSWCKRADIDAAETEISDIYSIPCILLYTLLTKTWCLH